MKMYFSSKEDYNAFIQYQNYVAEINWCMREQKFMKLKMTDREIEDVMRVFEEILEEYKEQFRL